MLRFLVAPERPRSAIIIHFAAEMNIVVHETCNLISELQKSLAPIVADTFLMAKMLRTGLRSGRWPAFPRGPNRCRAAVVDRGGEKKRQLGWRS